MLPRKTNVPSCAKQLRECQSVRRIESGKVSRTSGMDFYRRNVGRISVSIFWIGVCLVLSWSSVECAAHLSLSWTGFPVVYICTYSGSTGPLRLPPGVKRNQVLRSPILFLIESQSWKGYQCLLYIVNTLQETTPVNNGKESDLLSSNLSQTLHSKCPTFRLLNSPFLDSKPHPFYQHDVTNLSCVKEISIESKIRVARSTETLSVVSGKMLTIGCGITTFEAKEFRWEKDSLKLPVNHRQRIMQDGSLVIENAQKEDEGTYKCFVKDVKGSDHAHTIVVKVIAAPTISLSPFEPDIQVGMKMKVLCSVLRGNPPFRFKWIKDGTPVSLELGLSIQYHKDWSMLSSDNVELNHAGNYTCAVSNEADTAFQSSILKVNESPRWITEPKDSDVVHGKSARIDCIATGSPLPSITWKRAAGPEHGDFTPVYNSNKYTLFANGSLVVQNADKSEEGYYLCQANNGIGVGLSKLIYIIVHEPPRFEIKFKAHAVKKGDSANLFCQATGDPPIKIHWWTNSQQIENSSRIRIEILPDEQKKSVGTTLMITQTKSEDSGVYTCRAANSYGEDETRVQLLVQEPPGPPPNLAVVNVTGRSITVTWNEPYRGNSAITRYLLQYSMLDDPSDRRNLTAPSNQMQATLVNLKPSSMYMIRLSAENSVGWGQPTGWLNKSTDEEAPGGTAENISVRPTGPNSIKVSWKPPKKDTWHGGITGYYVGYKFAASSEAFHYKTVKADDEDRLYEAHLTNLKRSTTYVVIVQAFNAKGTGPSTDEVTVKTLDDVPPSAPVLKHLSSSRSSITIGWSQKTTFGNPIRAYWLYHRKEGGQWKQTSVKTQTPLYVINDLACGTGYQFYITAHNSVGKSEPSKELNARTEGAAPLSPSKEDFISPATNEAILNMQSWKSGGCDITHFTIKIRQKFRRQWRNLSNELSTNQSQFVMSNLIPSTWYELHITAHSAAGDTEAQYEFKTWNTSEAELSIRATSEIPRPKSPPLVTDLEILIPIVVSGLVVLVVVIVGCILCSKETHCNTRNNAMRHSSSKYARESVTMKELGSPPPDCISSEDGTQRSSSRSTSHYPSGQPLYCPRPEDENETQPYSTPYDTLPMEVLADLPPPSVSVHSLARVDRTDNIYTSRQPLRERPYEALIVTSWHFPDEVTVYPMFDQ